MKKLFFTEHALYRCQQRGVNTDIVEFIYNYGIKSNKHGDKRFLITKNCINKYFHEDEYFRKFFSNMKNNSKEPQS